MSKLERIVAYPSLAVLAALAVGRLEGAHAGPPASMSFDVPTAHEIRVVGPDGNSVLLSLGGSADGGVLEVRDVAGARSLALAGHPGGGRIAVLAPDGSRCAYVGCADKTAAGILVLAGKEGKGAVEAGVGADGGYASLLNRSGKPAAFVGVAEGGAGVVEAHDAEGAVMAQLAAGEGGGHVDIHGSGGEMLGTLSAPKSGKAGLLRILAQEGDPVAELGGTELGGQLDLLGRRAKAFAILKASDMGGQLLLNRADGTLGEVAAAYKDGGQLALLDHEGSRVVELSGGTQGGQVDVRTREGKDAVRLAVGTPGGQVTTTDAKGKAAVLPAK